MLLVIEDKDDPAGGIAVECDGPGETELAYIPAIRILFQGEPSQVRRECALQRMCYEWRQEGMLEEDVPSPRASLVSLYLKALLNTGWPPFSPTPSGANGGAGEERIKQLSQKV